VIDWSESDGVWELRLAHPPVNEIGTEVLASLERFLDAIERSAARALVVHSERPGFCAGADLRELHAGIVARAGAAYGAELEVFLRRVHRVMNRLDALPLPTVGAVHGVCFGGGFELALTLDVLVADRTARFCFPELRLGIIPGFGGIPRLEREVPQAVVRDLILSGRSINAKKAAALGLVGQVVAAGEAPAVARELARQLARFEPRVTAAAKGFIKRVPEARLEEELSLFLSMVQRPEVVAALGAFVASDDPMPYLPGAPREVQP
jgi:enoyl-CoA hydratase